MYDPLQNDNYNEWIELYNPSNQSINISGWSICDNYAEDFIEADSENGNATTTIIPPYSYAVIADHGTKIYENFTIPNSTIRLCVDDKSIGNGLGNNGDMLVLKNNYNATIDSLEWANNYTEIKGKPIDSVEEGHSICRHSNSYNNNSSVDFYEGLIPTPGSKNLFIPGKNKITIENTKTSYYIRKDERLSIPLSIKNSGYFLDNITIKIITVSDGWTASLKQEKVKLEPNETQIVFLQIIPFISKETLTSSVTILVESEKEFGESDEITFSFEMLGSDLNIKQIKTYNEEGEENSSSYQGEIIRFKAFLKNFGNENATNVYVRFYYDTVDDDQCIGVKYYDSVSKYQKYPSVKLDTVNMKPGFHQIIVVVDKENYVDELDETNNILTTKIQIIDTTPSDVGKRILITDLYYHSHPGLYNEYIKIYNPSDEDYDLSGCYLTNNPLKNKKDQTKIIFPENTTINGQSFLILSENTETYLLETGEKPDFEYNQDTDSMTPQMNSSKKFIMSNKGCMVALKDQYNHTIDIVVYGEINYTIKFWDKKPVASSGEGVVLKRNKAENNRFVDTNTSDDWIHPRKFKIGQSNFEYKNITFNGEIQTFVSPDNSFEVIVSELRKANKSVYFNIYEFTNPFLCDELVSLLRRNVSITIFLEGSPVGGISNEEKFILKRITAYGGLVRVIANDVERNIHSRYSFDHGKYLIIDNKTVIVESCNWANTGVPKNPTYGNREWGVIIRNTDVAEYFYKVFFDDYNPLRCDSHSFSNLSFNISSGFFMDKTVKKGFYNPVFESEVITGNFTIMPVISPDNSQIAISDLLGSAKKSIYVEQLYIYKNWTFGINPFVELLANKSKQGIDVKVILNYNPNYKDSCDKSNITKKFLEENGVEVKFVYTNWSCFINTHNKGVIVDNESVLISSINWNENSVTCNREAGVIIKNNDVADYYTDVFFFDWNLNKSDIVYAQINTTNDEIIDNYENTIYIIIIFTLTFALIAQDWRKRKWA